MDTDFSSGSPWEYTKDCRGVEICNINAKNGRMENEEVYPGVEAPERRAEKGT